MNERKLHFWIKQLRRPLCILLALSIVFIYGFVAHADGTSDFDNRFSSDLTNMSDLLYGGGMLSNYTANGGDITKLPGSPSSNSSGIMSSNYLTSLGSASSFLSNFKTFFSSYTFPSSFTYQSVTYDLTNAYTLVAASTWDYTISARDVFLIISEGNIAMVNGYFVSDTPIYIYAPNNGNVNQMTIYSQTTVSDNGFYCYLVQSIPANGAFTNSYPKKLLFTDLDVFYASTDGFSGFESFSTTSTDFDFSNTANYFNFNYLKTGGAIVAPGDPVASPVYDQTGKHYNYGSAVSSVYGSPFNSLYVGTTLSVNDYMRSHANQFYVVFENTVGLKVSGENRVSYFTDGGSYFSLDRLVRNGTWSFNVLIDPGLWMNGGQSMSAYLRSGYQVITNTNPDYYSDGSWSVVDDVLNVYFLTADYKKYNYNGIKNILQGPGKLEVANITTKVYFVFNADGDYDIEEENKSGSYVVTFNLLSGDYLVGQNDISKNLNPLEGGSNYPIVYPDGSTATSGNSGGNVISNNSVVNFSNAIEYLFNIDITDLENLQGNMADNYNFVIRNVADTSSNGFWAVLTETYSLIPDDIWTWIKTAVAAILMCAVYRVYISHYRLK